MHLYSSLPDAMEETKDFDISYHCAFTFPAVLQALGKEGWSQLCDCYTELITIPSTYVKQSLAASLGEVASMIGTDAAEEYLVPFAENLLESDTAEIVTSVMQAIRSFFPILTEASRRRLSGVSLLQCNHF